MIFLYFHIPNQKTPFQSNHPILKGLKSVCTVYRNFFNKTRICLGYIYTVTENLLFLPLQIHLDWRRKKIQMKKTKDFGSILLPFSSIPETIRVSGKHRTIEVNLDKIQISFSFENTYLVSRIIDGIFPDYKQIVPKSYTPR